MSAGDFSSGRRSLPAAAAWRHLSARVGFECTYFAPASGAIRVDGSTTAVEDGTIWTVSYSLVLDDDWRTRSVSVSERSVDGERSVFITADGEGSWWVDGDPEPLLDGCIDIDLESSVFTNALPVNRLNPPVGDAVDTPAAYVRLGGHGVRRLDQTYRREPDIHGHARYLYSAPEFGVTCELEYDRSGLLLDYPDIAVRQR